MRRLYQYDEKPLGARHFPSKLEVSWYQVGRLKLAVGRVLQHLVDAFLRFAGENGDAELVGDFDVSLDLGEHGEAASDVKAADPHLDTVGAEATRQVERPGELFDCTPTNPTRPRPPLLAMPLTISRGRTLVLVSSIAATSMGRSGPSTWRVAALRARL